MSTLQATSSTNDRALNSSRPGIPDRARIINSEDLLEGRRELWIEHGDDMYRLRRTSSGKLYLTK
jgi:hemin uptake protein HemP